jgi:hypothetical protein
MMPFVSSSPLSRTVESSMEEAMLKSQWLMLLIKLPIKLKASKLLPCKLSQEPLCKFPSSLLKTEVYNNNNIIIIGYDAPELV